MDLYFFALGLAEQAGGFYHQHGQHHHIGGNVLETLGEIHPGERLDHADDEAADDRPGKAAEPADHRRRKRLQPDEAHIDVHEGDRRQQHAGKRRHGGADGPDEAVQPAHRDAHVIGGELILGRGLHGDADARVAEKQEQDGAQQHGGRDDHHMLHADHQFAGADDFVPEGGRQRMRLGAPEGHHGNRTAGDVAQTDRHDYHGKRRLAQDRPQRDALDQETDQRHADQRDRYRGPVRQAHSGSGGEPEKGAEHHQLALGEVDRLGGLVDEDEAERDHAVDAALRDAADQDLEDLHAVL